MKLYSLTDISTPQLEKQQMVGQPTHLLNYSILPGEMLELPPDCEAICRAAIQQYVRDGILSVNTRPTAYAAARAKQERLKAALEKRKEKPDVPRGPSRR